MPSYKSCMTFFRAFFWTCFCAPVSATRATKKEYSDDFGPQNDSKMEPKTETNREGPTLTKHRQALSKHLFCPLPGAPFSMLFWSLQKSHQKTDEKGPFSKFSAESTENGLPKGGPRVSHERGFRTFWSSWAPLGATMAPRPRPRAPRAPPNLDFGEF